MALRTSSSADRTAPAGWRWRGASSGPGGGCSGSSDIVRALRELGDAVPDACGLVGAQRRDAVRAAGGVDHHRAQAELIGEPRALGVDVLDADRRDQRAGDYEDAAAQVDLVVAQLVAPVAPAALGLEDQAGEGGQGGCDADRGWGPTRGVALLQGARSGEGDQDERDGPAE